MKKSTLGLIETYGFVGAVEALDVAAKVADIELMSCEFVRGGIVTILITGDVSSVKVAVETAEAAVNKLGVLRNTHVIAKADDGVWDILNIKNDLSNIYDESENDLFFNDAESIEKYEQEFENEDQKNCSDYKEEATFYNHNESFNTRDELERLKVPELRTMARGIKNIQLTKIEIKYSKKEQLIDSILMANRGRKDK